MKITLRQKPLKDGEDNPPTEAFEGRQCQSLP